VLPRASLLSAPPALQPAALAAALAAAAASAAPASTGAALHEDVEARRKREQAEVHREGQLESDGVLDERALDAGVHVLLVLLLLALLLLLCRGAPLGSTLTTASINAGIAGARLVTLELMLCF